MPRYYEDYDIPTATEVERKTQIETAKTIAQPVVPKSALEELQADRKSTRLNSSHVSESRMPSSA